jgi:endonuclease YncB( thermonuclease family)
MEINILNKLSNIKNDDIELYNLNNITTIGKIVDIYDGDTCKIVLLINNSLQKHNCRLLGIDTPEMKPLITKINREDEILNATKCRNRLLQLCTSCDCKLDQQMKKIECKHLLDNNNKIINIKCHEFDKYGRLLVELFTNDKFNKSVNQLLVDEGFAKSYGGGTKEEFTY